mgnify:CR=1 FL=1
MVTVNSDVDKFNQCVRDQLEVLNNRRETTHDLLITLFKDYQAANDQKFNSFIQRKKYQYDKKIRHYKKIVDERGFEIV